MNALDRVVVGERAERREQLAGRPDRAGDDHGAGSGVRDLARELGRAAIELEDAAFGAVQLQAVTIAAERVGEDEVGTGVDERAVELLHPLGVLDVPELRRLARLEAHREVVGAGRAVGQEHPAGCEKGVERAAHIARLGERASGRAQVRRPAGAFVAALVVAGRASHDLLRVAAATSVRNFAAALPRIVVTGDRPG